MLRIVGKTLTAQISLYQVIRPNPQEKGMFSFPVPPMRTP